MRLNLDMKSIQYMNLFERFMGTRPNYCFDTNVVIFTVPRGTIISLRRRMQGITRLENNIHKKVKIIATPSGIHDLDSFVKSIVAPSRLKKIIVQDNEIILITGQSARERANIIGKNKTKLNNLSELLDNFFGIKKVIVR